MKVFLKKLKNYWESDASFISLLAMLVITIFILPIIIDRGTDTTLLLNIMFIGLFFVGIFSSSDQKATIASILMLCMHLFLRLVRFSNNPFEFYFIERIVIVIKFYGRKEMHLHRT